MLSKWIIIGSVLCGLRSDVIPGNEWQCTKVFNCTTQPQDSIWKALEAVFPQSGYINDSMMQSSPLRLRIVDKWLGLTSVIGEVVFNINAEARQGKFRLQTSVLYFTPWFKDRYGKMVPDNHHPIIVTNDEGFENRRRHYQNITQQVSKFLDVKANKVKETLEHGKSQDW